MAKNFTATASMSNMLALTKVSYTSGNGDGISEGDTLTQGAVTAAVRKITIDSGTFAGGDAAGDIWCQYTANAATGFASGAATSTGDTLTLATTVTEEIIDARWAKTRYFLAFSYTPGSGATTPVFATSVMFGINMTADDLGFNLDASDHLFLPLSISHGRRSEQRQGGFYVAQLWDNSAGILYIIIEFQGLEGDGNKDTSTIKDFLHSMDISASECGDLVSLDLSSASFRVVVETTDDSAGGGSGLAIADSSGLVGGIINQS